MSAHVLPAAGHTHHVFDNAIEPVLSIDTGDTVVFECIEATGGQLNADSTIEDLKQVDTSRVHTITGPVFVRGAEPGDTLVAEVLEIAHDGWGWQAITPDVGILAEDFGETYDLHVWRAGSDGRAAFRNGIRVPIEPFMGVLGVAQKEPGPRRTLPPTHLGWNLDTRHVVEGTLAYFPVEVPGALFSTGDGHLMQGDGEVCCYAVEAPLTVTLRFDVLRGQSIESVELVTRSPTTTKTDGMGHYVTTATGPDLYECAKDAVRRMIDLLGRDHGMSPNDAYLLCTAAADLKIGVALLMDGGANLVTYHLPRSIL
jgi:acetamidase/formamidase